MRALLCFCLLINLAFAQSDREREARWRAEIEPTIVVGDAVTLSSAAPKEDFLAIWNEVSSNKKTAIVLVHGVGVHPDFGLIGQLRVLLADAGYSTLAIQMPVLGKEVSNGDAYQVTFPQATARLKTAASWLQAKGFSQLILASHSMGAWMSNVYFETTPNTPYAAWVCIGITGRIGSLGNNNLPILDLTGSKDLEPTLRAAWLRRLKLMGIAGSQTIVVEGANHYFEQHEKNASKAIADFIRTLK
jgi:alpha/beta superfamily hydrolase